MNSPSPIVDAAIQDFLNRRFGLFIHWGAYSQLGGKWRGRGIGNDIGEWVMNCLQIPIAEYERIAAAFNPSSFDADALVRLAAEAGMRYVVLTAKHHDGFAMFHSRCDRYNVVDWTGGKRDVAAELAAACKKHGMKLGFYYSQALDWHEEHAGGWDVKPWGLRPTWANIWDFPDNDKKQFDLYFRKKVLPQVTELLTRYGDIFLIWFDTPRTINAAQSEELYQLVKSLQPACLVNSRIGNEKGDYGSLGDNQIPAVTMENPTETPTTLNDTWGYKEDDQNWKTSPELVELLCKVASRGVNLLLNIGPRGDGSLTPETIAILRELGAWNRQNGAAVHDTRGCPIPGGFEWGYLTRGERDLYLCVRDTAPRTIHLNGLLTAVTSVRLLGDSTPIPFRQEASPDGTLRTLALTLPATSGVMPVLAVRCADTPRFEELPQTQNGTLILHPLAATLFDGQTKAAASVIMPRLYEVPPERQAYFDAFGRMRLSVAGLLTGWNRSADWIEWQAKFVEAGDYRIDLITRTSDHADHPPFDGEIVLTLTPGETVRTRLRDDHVYSESRSNREENLRSVTHGGMLHMDAPGERRIRLSLSRDLRADERDIPLVELRLVAASGSRPSGGTGNS